MPSSSTESLSQEIDHCLRTHIDQLCQTDRLPGTKGYEDAKTYLKDQIRAAGYEVQSQRFECQSKQQAENIYCETKADDSHGRVLIGAHYDSLKSSGQGADDNASAVAILIELMKRIPSDRAFSFVFFDREERHRWTALEGSNRFAAYYKAPLSRVVIMDLVGGVLAPGFESFYFQFGQGFADLSHPELEIRKFPMKLLEPMGSFIPRSDYHAFRKKGISFCFLSSGTPWYYHTPYDTPERLNFAKMTALTETLLQEKVYRSPRVETLDWKNWSEFLEKLSQFESLGQDPLFRKLSKSSRAPSRWNLIQFYKRLLGFLRSEKESLWKKRA